jgi:hypothetical protein
VLLQPGTGGKSPYQPRPGKLASLLEQQEEIAVTCEFCHEDYVFSREELEQLLEEMELS